MFEYSRSVPDCCTLTAERMDLLESWAHPFTIAPSIPPLAAKPEADFDAHVAVYSDEAGSNSAISESGSGSRPAWCAEAPPRRLSARERLAALTTMNPGPLVMSELAGIDASALSGSEAITYLQIHDRVASWWAAQQVAALVRAAGPDRHVDKVILFDDVLAFDSRGSVTIVDAVREEIAAALRWSPSTAQRRIDSARLLNGPMSDTRRAMATGAITPGHADAMLAAAQRLDGAWSLLDSERAKFSKQCEEFQSRVLPIAGRATVARTRQAAARSLHAIDPAGALRRRHDAQHQRDVFVVNEDDGISLLMARMSTEHAHACLSAVNAIVGVPQCGAAPGRTPIGVRRAEALATLILSPSDPASRHHMTSSEAPDGCPGLALAQHHGQTGTIRSHVHVVIDLATLLGLQDGAAELLGAGPIPAEVVRGLLDDATMRRIITDPLTGNQLDYGRRVYAVPQRLREFIVARDGTCRFPGCARRASACQIDHARAWNKGGRTDPANLGALCTRHHQLKTHGGWAIEGSDATGTCTWVSPQGRRYAREANDLLDASRLPPSTAPPDPLPF